MLKEIIKNDEDVLTSLYKSFNDFQKEYDLLYTVNVTKDVLSDIFNKNVSVTPLFREKPVWHCSTCRHSLRFVARIVTITDDYQRLPFLKYYMDKYDLSPNYSFLQSMFSEYIDLCNSMPIQGLLYSRERLVGVKENIETESGLVFKHVHFEVDKKYLTTQNVIDKFQGLKATVSKYHKHIHLLEDVLNYIEEGFLYRGQEKASIVQETITILQQYREEVDLDLFCWKHVYSKAAYFNNDVISTLIDDLKEKDPNKAVKNYNVLVAPSNYRQPKVDVVSVQQIKQTQVELDKLGFSNFVEGFSFAEAKDILVTNVLWTNRKLDSKGSLTDLLSDSIKKPKVKIDELQSLSFLDFLDLLRRSRSIQVDTSNLEKVVLIKDNFDSPVYCWENHIGFCYQTGLADVDKVTKRVLEKGGEIDAKVRFSLYWENLDDLDLHLERGRIHIYYARKSHRNTGFQLDIDMNVSTPVRGAVENIFAKEIMKQDLNSDFLIYVHNFTKREQPQKCILNVYENNKLIKQFEFMNPPLDRSINLVEFKVTEQGLEFIWTNKDAEKAIESELNFVEIDTIMLSPNCWGDRKKGNRHIFFIRKGEEIRLTNVRPYNIEQLRDELIKHRKVLQLLSRKVKIHGKPNLVGYGISLAKDRKVPLRIDGRPYILHMKPWEDVVQRLEKFFAEQS